jgi:hypothetical protein
MSNVYLSAFGDQTKKSIPTPRLRALLSDKNVSVCDFNVMDYDLKKGLLPFYKINTSALYKAEKAYLNLPPNYNMFFCLPATQNKIEKDFSCSGGLDWLHSLFGLDPENVEEVCIRYVSTIKSKKVKHFCSTWDKSFHLLQSLVRVTASAAYELTPQQKEIFSLAWAKILSTARLRMDLDCESDIQEMGLSAPLWLQQFSKGIVVIDTSNKMISNALITDMSTYLDNSYMDLKAISLSMCKSFLVTIKNNPEYGKFKPKIDEWIKVCDKMGSRNKIKRSAFSASLVFGIIGSIVLLKKLVKAA